MRFDLTDLVLFLHVTESGSITGGAERAHIALASASARIRGMEEALGIPLLVRERRGVEPTPAGRALVHHARIALRQQERMRGELGEYAQGLKGHVRIMCNTASLTEFLPEALSTFLVTHPNVNIDLEERLSYEIVAAVAEGMADVGIIANSVDIADLETFPFRSDRMVLVTARKHSLAGRANIHFSETLDYDFIGLQEGSALQDYLSEQAAHTGRRLKYRVRLRSFDAVCRMVESDVGICVIPEAAADRCKKSMDIRAISLLDPWASRELIICVKRFDDLPIYAQQVIEQIRAQ
ncbi:MAG TPA: LysR family transcriptional regulator [Burkholderiaceae bacterium]|jgi:DNA-binding transcriptional LysR family regulator|nr:LysR family transcriptional regulator [Burkholderiaceae bacterium]